MSLSAAIALAAAALGQVVLRGSDQPDPRQIVSIDIRGVQVGDPDANSVELLGWESIKLVMGDRAADAEPFLPLADIAWRARSRLARGDTAFAEPLLEQVYEKMEGAPSPTTLLAAAGLVHSRLAAGDSQGALAPFFASVALTEEGIRLSPEDVKSVAFDENDALFAGLPPIWSRGAAPVATLQSIDPAPPGVLSGALHTLYLAVANVDEGRPGTMPDLQEALDHPGVAFVRELVATRAGASDERAPARRELESRLPLALGSWKEAWIRAALGRSLMLERDRRVRDLAILELLQLPARFQDTQPVLARIALEDVLAEMQSRGEAAHVATLTRQLRLAERHAPIMTLAGETAADPSGALERYLDVSGFHELRAVHLEEQLGSAEGGRRADVARRLAGVYALLLESPANEEQRLALEKRSLEVLADVPEADSLELRLTLARSAYTRAEQTAERWRLRLVPRAEADAAAGALAELESTFSDMATAAMRRVESLERQEEQVTSAGDRALVGAALSSARRTRSMAHFLAGWSAYYAAELSAPAVGAGLAEPANKAERHFGWLLNARSGSAPTIERVPEQLLSYEHVARSVMGVALCQSLKGSDEGAIRWLDFLEKSDSVAPAIREQIPARRMIVLARAARWDELKRLLPAQEMTGEAPGAVSPTSARLIAVLALEARAAGDKSGALPGLVERALEALASQGQLAQVIDLASRYFDRLDDLGEGEFMPAYIRGVREYDRARKAHQESGQSDERPTTVPEAVRFYEAAATFLASAIAAKDAARFPSALGGVAVLRAFAAFYAARDADTLEKSAIMFSQAAERFPSGDVESAANARRLAIRAIDAAVEFSGTPALTARRRSLIDDFLARHPMHEAAPALLYQRATAPGVSVDQAVHDLLTIADDSALALPARFQAARLLYERYIASPYESRADAAEAFLAVGEPLLDESRRAASGGDADSTQRAAVNARRVLDAMLSRPGADPQRAQRALDLLSSLIARGQVTSTEVKAEAEYRRAQIALLRDDPGGAEEALARLAELDPKLAGAAGRLFYQHAADRWLAAQPSDAGRLELARRVVDQGSRVIRDATSGEDSPKDAPTATLHATVARAAAFLWMQKKDEAARELASLLFRGLLRQYPNDAAFLRDAAMHAEQASDDSTALEAWRGLLAGLPSGTGEWFEAKCRVVSLLVRVDPLRAREVLHQHRTLYPDYGPAPWGARLRELQKKVEDGA